MLHRIGRARGLGRLISCVLALVVVGIVVALPTAAFGYHTDTRETRGAALPIFACSDCHVTWSPGAEFPNQERAGFGPHGYYRSDTQKCTMCHAVHNAPGTSILLLPEATIQAACFTCHDATGAQGVYSGITARGGSVNASHAVDVTAHVPGGSADLPAMLTCTSCHTVHRATTLAPFRTDRHLPSAGAKLSNALLRDDVGGKPRGTYTAYGADWCASCHDQRHSNSLLVINHPVESSKTVGVPTFQPFTYGRIATVVDATSRLTVIVADGPGGAGMGLGYTNYGYVMPWPRTLEQTGHKPICQQCHEDARPVGNVGAAVDFPAGQLDFSFPHQTTTGKLMVEERDGLCLNCHPVGSQP